MQTEFILATGGPGFHEITGQIAAWLDGAGARDGLLTLLVRHTSASLLIQENADPDVTRDLGTFLGRLAPPAGAPGTGWMRHTSEGPDDMPAHIKAALLPTCLQVPVLGGVLLLGTWQGIYLVEHRDRPHRRRVAAHFAP
jgi:secondary thiamine-phosphate synthase enzyme